MSEKGLERLKRMKKYRRVEEQMPLSKFYDRKLSVSVIAAFYFRCAPLAASGMYLLKLLFSLLPFLTVIVSAGFVDRALAVSEEGYGAALGSAFLIALLMLVREIGNNFYSFLRTRQWSRAYPMIDRMIMEKISLLPYAQVENEEVQDILSRVREDPEGLLSGILEGYLGLAGFLISNVSLVAMLVTQAPVWVSVLISGMLCLFGVFAVKGGERQYKAQAEVTLRRRKAEYYGDILGNREMANERMLFQYGEWVNEAFLRESREARNLERKARRWWFIGMNVGAYIAIGISIIVIFVLMRPVLQGKTSVGLFVSLVTAFMAMTRNISWQLPNLLKEMSRGRRMLKDFETVLGMQDYRKNAYPEKNDAAIEYAKSNPAAASAGINPAEESFADSGFQSLEFRNVCFRYPGTEKEVLKNISFRIEKGKHYAFAGRNGCGKSTVVKLILGLYEPDAGEILLNGIPVEKYDPNRIWAMFGVLFQDYARYPLTVYENIALGSGLCSGDSSLENEETDTGKNFVPGRGGTNAGKDCGTENIEPDDEISKPRERILQAAADAGMDDDFFKKLPQGPYTELGKLSQHSVDLSGGEWQRVAMARMNCSAPPVRILDEPTAAMDPVQEQTVYREFFNKNQDATTIMITHRLGAACLSDEILVIEDGGVMEKGSHSVLMEKQGIYKEMFEKQREWYL